MATSFEPVRSFTWNCSQCAWIPFLSTLINRTSFEEKIRFCSYLNLIVNVYLRIHFEYAHSFPIEYLMAIWKENRRLWKWISRVEFYLIATKNFTCNQSIFQYYGWSKDDMIFEDWDWTSPSLENPQFLSFRRFESIEHKPNEDPKPMLTKMLNID